MIFRKVSNKNEFGAKPLFLKLHYFFNPSILKKNARSVICCTANWNIRSYRWGLLNLIWNGRFVLARIVNHGFGCMYNFQNVRHVSGDVSFVAVSKACKQERRRAKINSATAMELSKWSLIFSKLSLSISSSAERRCRIAWCRQRTRRGYFSHYSNFTQKTIPFLILLVQR